MKHHCQIFSQKIAALRFSAAIHFSAMYEKPIMNLLYDPFEVVFERNHRNNNFFTKYTSLLCSIVISLLFYFGQIDFVRF